MEKIPTKNAIKAVVFAGGVGTRMWPLSRVRTPKQFEKIIDKKSTLQMTIDRLRPEFSWENIYISTGAKYKHIISQQLPKIPLKNIISEPARRDVAASVGYASSILAKTSSNEPFVILWSDHLMKKVSVFKKVLQTGGEFINSHKNKFLFIGQEPRFANQNLGWIELGKEKNKINGFSIYEFKSWKYRPNIQLARQFYKSKRHYIWNPGYWIVTPSFVLEQYKRFMPEMYKKLIKLQQSYGTKEHSKQLGKIYPTLEKISFDDAILEKLEPEKAVVLPADFGWSDIGTWQALKEALQVKKSDNVTKGEVFSFQCENNLIYNYNKQIITAIDLEGLVVINTNDVLLICPQESMKNIKKVVNQFKQTKNKKYT